MQKPECIKCGENIDTYSRSDVLRCDNCGATYESVAYQMGDQHVEFTYEFRAYKCMHSTLFDKCEAECPAPYMNCLEHLEEKHFNQAKSRIKDALEKVEQTKETLRRMEEAKKTWLIKEVSGIDEDHTIPENKNG